MYILCDWGRWGGVFLKKKGKKIPQTGLCHHGLSVSILLFLWLLPKKKKSCFRCFQLWLKERMCDRVHRSSRIFWRNKLAAWFFGAVPRLLGSNPARWKDEIWMTHWIHSNLRLIELKIPQLLPTQHIQEGMMNCVMDVLVILYSWRFWTPQNIQQIWIIDQDYRCFSFLVFVFSSYSKGVS